MKTLHPFVRLRGLAIIGAMFLTMLLGGCSTVGLVYNQAPALLYFWLDDYVDFDKTQAALAKDSLKTLHAWHRAEELPKLASQLHTLQTLANGAVSASQLCATYQQFAGQLFAPMEQALPDMARLASGLSPAQMQTLSKALRKRNTQWQEDWIKAPQQKVLDKRASQWIDRLESLYGDLSDSQQAQVRNVLLTSGWDADTQYRENLRRQQDMLQVFAVLQGGKLAPKESQQQLRDWLERSRHSPDEKYRTYNARLLQNLCSGVAALHNSTTPAQRTALIKALQSYETETRQQSQL